MPGGSCRSWSFAVALTFVAGFAVDRSSRPARPGIDLANSFDTFGQRGALVAVTAFVMVAGAIGLGTVIGTRPADRDRWR